MSLAFFHGLPAWVDAAWAVGVWGGVLGSVLLLARRSMAAGVFLASLIGMILTRIQNYLLSNGMEVMGDPFSLGLSVAIFLIALALYLYARAMHQKQILR